MEVIASNGLYNDLSSIEKDCWQRMVSGALHANDVMHNAAVANTNALGINMRTVVLRKASPAEKQLFFYTDTRSGKWAELERQNNISWLFYDAEAYIQIRLSGAVNLHTYDRLADAAWAENTLSNRKNYLSELSPSTETANPVSDLTPATEKVYLTMEQSEAGRKNFGLIITNIVWMEWLWLNKNGHRRANFIYGKDNNFMANWLVP